MQATLFDDSASAGEARSAAEQLSAELLAELDRHRAVWAKGQARPRLRLVFRDGHSRELWLLRLAAAGRGALLGVRAQTLRGLALELLERRHQPSAGPRRRALEMRRALEQEPALAEPLKSLDRGLDAALPSLQRLFEAGFEPSLAPALLEALEEGETHSLPAALAERGRALLRAANRCLEACPGARPAEWAAAELLDSDALPADERLLLIDPDRDRPGQRELCARLQRRAGVVLLELPEATDVGQRVERFGAADPALEMRLLLERCQSAISAGTAPERIGLAVYGLPQRRAALRTHAQRLGLALYGAQIPGPLAPAGRHLAACVELLHQGERLPIGRLLDAVAPQWVEQRAESSAAALRLGARVLGAVDVESAARLDLARLLGHRQELPLPVRLGALEPAPEEDSDAAGEAEGNDSSDAAEEAEEAAQEALRYPAPGSATNSSAGRPSLERQKLPRSALQALIDLAQAAQRWLANTEPRPLAQHLAESLAFLQEQLLWRQEEVLHAEVLQALDSLASEFPSQWELSGAEWRWLLEAELSDRGREPLGGRGGGLQVASGAGLPRLPYDLVLIAGLERGQAPRRPSEDALLSGRLLQVLAPLLPDLLPDEERADGRGQAERRALEALCRLAPTSVLSRAQNDANGRELAAAPLWLAGGANRPHSLEDRSPPQRPADAFEAAHLAAPGLRPEELGPWFELLAPAGLPNQQRSAWAHGRSEVLTEWSQAPSRGQRLGPSPYHGFVGPLPSAGLAITTLEALARCGWRAFLERVLKLEPSPNPLYAWPALDNQLVGELVHRVLEELVRAALKAGQQPVPRPNAAAAEACLERLGQSLALERGLVLPGLARVLIERAAAPLELALALEWNAGPLPIEAVEASGQCLAEDGSGRQQALLFRADRQDRDATGVLLTDYKSGRSFADNAKEATRLTKIQQALARGDRLQAFAYALGGGPGARGRYVFLDPEKQKYEAARVLSLSAAEPRFARAFAHSVGALLDAWNLGSLGPRLLAQTLSEEHAQCRTCRLAEACIRQDSGQRGRLERFAAGLQTGADQGPEAAAWGRWFALEQKPAPEVP